MLIHARERTLARCRFGEANAARRALNADRDDPQRQLQRVDHWNGDRKHMRRDVDGFLPRHVDRQLHRFDDADLSIKPPNDLFCKANPA
jgi:hypothetical protein